MKFSNPSANSGTNQPQPKPKAESQPTPTAAPAATTVTEEVVETSSFELDEELQARKDYFGRMLQRGSITRINQNGRTKQWYATIKLPAIKPGNGYDNLAQVAKDLLFEFKEIQEEIQQNIYCGFEMGYGNGERGNFDLISVDENTQIATFLLQPQFRINSVRGSIRVVPKRDPNRHNTTEDAPVEQPVETSLGFKRL